MYIAFVIIIIIIIGTLLHLSELQAYKQNSSLKNFNWFNSFWCSFITMTTVGYGELFPVTALGRVITVMWSFIGIFLSSLFIAALLQYLNFSNGEGYSYTLQRSVKSILTIKYVYQQNKFISNNFSSKKCITKLEFINFWYNKSKKHIHTFVW